MNKINYYGETDNYIHLKFGDCRKMYNFTKEFTEKYPDFAREYQNYFMGEKSMFETPEQVVDYVFDNNLPINWYFNFTDEHATSREEIEDYLVNEK